MSQNTAVPESFGTHMGLTEIFRIRPIDKVMITSLSTGLAISLECCSLDSVLYVYVIPIILFTMYQRNPCIATADTYTV